MGQITIRLPGEIEQQIRVKAAKEHRSVNAQILVLLEQTLTQDGGS